jgi:arabinogalactan oligomer/maltooligosaccharide transport system substrate-binding protein
MEAYIHKNIFLALYLMFIAAFVLVACTPAVSVSTATQVMTEESASQEDTMEELEGEIKTTEEPLITEEPDTRLTGQVSIWHSLDENEINSLNGVIEIFQELNPGVEFDVLYVPPYDLQGKFESSAQIGGGACVVMGSYAWGPQLFDSLLIADISEFASDEFLATINPAALGLVLYSDAIVGLPMNVTGVLPFRNKSIIPDAPSTYAELVNFAQEATSGDVVGAYLDYGLFYSAGHLYGIGGQLMDADGNPTFNDDKGIEWIEMIQRFEEAGPIENNNDNDINLFVEGKAGIIIDGLWNASELAEAIGPENLAIDPWPIPMSGYVQTDNLYLNANSTGNELDTCWNFMEFMLSPESQQIFSDPSMAGHIPAILGVELTDPLQSQVMETFNGATAFPAIPEMSAYWDPVNNALLSVIEQGTNPADALQAAHDDVLDKLAEIHGE